MSSHDPYDAAGEGDAEVQLRACRMLIGDLAHAIGRLNPQAITAAVAEAADDLAAEHSGALPDPEGRGQPAFGLALQVRLKALQTARIARSQARLAG